MVTLTKPIIGAIHGSAAGGGTALALACDLRVMANNANIRYAFINIGLSTDIGAGWLLTRLVGYSKAFEITIEGEKIRVDECLKLGLTNKVVPPDQLLTAAKIWAHQLANKPTLAIGLTKLNYHHAVNHGLFENIEYEAQNQAKAVKSEDFQEGISAILEKRQPLFKGK